MSSMESIYEVLNEYVNEEAIARLMTCLPSIS